MAESKRPPEAKNYSPYSTKSRYYHESSWLVLDCPAPRIQSPLSTPIKTRENPLTPGNLIPQSPHLGAVPAFLM
jgi:hypothetical protein